MASLVTSAVPMLSMDLRALPAEHQRITRAWLAFYRQHRDLLLFGRQQLLSADSHHSLFSLHLGDEALWGAFTSIFPGVLAVPSENIRRMWILNGGAQERLYTRLEGVEGECLQIQLYDRGLEKSAILKLPMEDRTVILDLPVEIGGALELQSGSECL